MRYLSGFDSYAVNEGLKEWAIGTLMALSAMSAKSQDWVNRAANANLHFWEKCKLAQSAGGGYSAGGGRVAQYKNDWKRMSDFSSYDKDQRSGMKKSCPEGVDLDTWAALNQEAARVSAVFSNTDYDKYVDDKGLIIQDMSKMTEEEQRSMSYGISYLEPYFVYYRPKFPKHRKVTPQELLEFYRSLEGGLDVFKSNLEKGYGSMGQ
jgi:hypothetical protein